MKRIAIFCVNYNSYGELERYRLSVEAAAGNAKGTVSVDMFIADNTTANFKDIPTKQGIVSTTVFPYHENTGYFGGVKRMMGGTDVNVYDYIIISNVDVALDENAFTALSTMELGDDVGWIAPRIYSLKEKRDRNPQRINRCSRRRLSLLLLLFKHPLLNTIYKKTFYKRKKYTRSSQKTIYCGHGSYIILTREFFRKCGTIDYPVFLYGEEIYLAELCRRAFLAVEYHPEIVVNDTDHVSTGKMGSSFYNKCNVEALTYLLDTFY